VLADSSVQILCAGVGDDVEREPGDLVDGVSFMAGINQNARILSYKVGC
jgi:hypothetical protein